MLRLGSLVIPACFLYLCTAHSGSLKANNQPFEPKPLTAAIGGMISTVMTLFNSNTDGFIRKHLMTFPVPACEDPNRLDVCSKWMDGFLFPQWVHDLKNPRFLLQARYCQNSPRTGKLFRKKIWQVFRELPIEYYSEISTEESKVSCNPWRVNQNPRGKDWKYGSEKNPAFNDFTYVRACVFTTNNPPKPKNPAEGLSRWLDNMREAALRGPNAGSPKTYQVKFSEYSRYNVQTTN